MRKTPRPAPEPAPPFRLVLGDDALVAAAQAFDPTVVSTLCDRVWPQIEGTVRRLLGRADPDCVELAKRSLIELVDTIDCYPGDCSLDTWAQLLTSQLVFQHIRRRSAARGTLFRVAMAPPSAARAKPRRRWEMISENESLSENASVQRMNALATVDPVAAARAAAEYLRRFPGGLARSDALTLLTYLPIDHLTPD